ncbi:MAG: N-glycosylase/DNA lyase [Desulfurococcaceae archaeon]
MKIARVDRARCLELARIISDARGVIDELIELDPQMVAVRGLVARLGSWGAIAVVANALVSYNLSCRGEDYWLEFSRELAAEGPGDVRRAHAAFLRASRCNRLGLEAKLRRLEKFYGSDPARKLAEDPLAYCGRLGELRDEVARALGSSPGSKTIAFAAKMYYYALRALEGARADDCLEFPGEMPVDRRNALLSAASCIVVCQADLGECAEHLLRERSTAAEAWREVCAASGIPCAKLDTLTWLAVGALRDSGFDARRAAERLHGGRPPQALVRVLDELSACSRPGPRQQFPA